MGTCNVIRPYRVGVATVAREVVRYKLELTGVQVVRCGLHVTLCYFYKKLSCSYVTRSRERWRMKVLRFIAADNINIFCLTVETVNSASSHFTLSLLTTPTVKITVKDKYNKKTVYTLGWRDRLPSGCTKSFHFKTK